MLKELPKEVNINGLMFRIIERDGMIIFSELYGMCFCGQRIAFSRPKYSCWQVEIFPSFGQTIMASHIVEAFRIVKEYRGGDFGEIYKNE